MKFYDQVNCAKCKAMMGKEIRICPICGHNQSGAVKPSQPVAPPVPTRPSASYPSRTSYKAPSVPPVNYGSSPSARKNNDVVMILGGVLAIVVCAIIFIAVNHQNAPVITATPSSDNQAARIPSQVPATSPNYPPAATQTMGTPIAAPASRPADFRQPLSPSEAAGVVAYGNVLHVDSERLADSLEALADIVEPAKNNLQLCYDPAWKAHMTEGVAKVHNAANALANINGVPVECVPLQQEVQQVASIYDSAAHDFAEGVINENDQEVQKSLSEFNNAKLQMLALKKEEANFGVRYAN